MLSRRMLRSILLGLVGAGVCGANAAGACEVVHRLAGPPLSVDITLAHLDYFRSARFAKGQPSPDIARFIRYVQRTYLDPQHVKITHLDAEELAKLVGYAIGEAATKPAPIDVFAPSFKIELEQWIGRMSRLSPPPFLPGGPLQAALMWRLVEEGARGFYDEEMHHSYGSPTGATIPTSVEAWFNNLSGKKQLAVRIDAANAGFAREGGDPYSPEEFEAFLVLLDGQLTRLDLPDVRRREVVQDLADGMWDSLPKEL